ncbi:MAG: hypothetical protein E6R03_17590 [Hyphomicrobiaceae bacterium]|nr:MAG: hypothetical protein E6R03_17590 [Hyphomicrobiaceae bacterium]
MESPQTAQTTAPTADNSSSSAPAAAPAPDSTESGTPGAPGAPAIDLDRYNRLEEAYRQVWEEAKSAKEARENSEKALSDQKQRLSDLKSQRNVSALLSELGLTADELVSTWIAEVNGPQHQDTKSKQKDSSSEVDALTPKLLELQKQLEEVKNKTLSTQTQMHIAKMSDDFYNYTASLGDEYPLIKEIFSDHEQRLTGGKRAFFHERNPISEQVFDAYAHLHQNYEEAKKSGKYHALLAQGRHDLLPPEPTFENAAKLVETSLSRLVENNLSAAKQSKTAFEKIAAWVDQQRAQAGAAPAQSPAVPAQPQSPNSALLRQAPGDPSQKRQRPLIDVLSAMVADKKG